MGIRLRIFMCVEDYSIKPIYKGQMLEVYGELFKMYGYANSHIKTYEQLGFAFHKWREVTNIIEEDWYKFNCRYNYKKYN